MIGRATPLRPRPLSGQGAQWRRPEAELRARASVIGRAPLGAVTTERLAGIRSVFGPGTLVWVGASFLTYPGARFSS